MENISRKRNLVTRDGEKLVSDASRNVAKTNVNTNSNFNTN